jgi:hypothetical protein
MNKIIFQIGILGFCVSAVVFGGRGGSVLDIVSSSFIVFVGIVLAATVVVLFAGTMMQKNPSSSPVEKSADSTNAQQTQQQEHKA